MTMSRSSLKAPSFALAASTFALFFGAFGCSAQRPAGPEPTPEIDEKCGRLRVETIAPKTSDLLNRAYIVSRDSSDVTVIDLNTLDVIGKFQSCSGGHMLELNSDFTKAYIANEERNETGVFDTRTFAHLSQLSVAAEPTHLTLSRDGKMIGLVNEAADSVSFIDTASDKVIKVLPGFFRPHIVRWAPDGQFAYVANIDAHHVTRVSLSTLSIDGHIAIDGFEGPPNETRTRDESGFADVQIDRDGILYGAHAGTGRVLVYDTRTQKKMPDVTVGLRPWIVFAEHPFAEVSARVVPNFGYLSVSIIRDAGRVPTSNIFGADRESYGVNYSSRAPNKAFVMNRIKREVAVMDTTKNEVIDRIDVGGTTETASTTADGRFIVAAVSSANRVVVIDAVTHKLVKAFDDVGKYPWSVTIPQGQNYCH
jgi:DNA-binding beta-propeller fold protein YncE